MIPLMEGMVVIQILVLTALTCIPVLGQGPSWSRVNKLAPGERIQVLDKEGKTIDGQFQGLAEGQLTLAIANQVRSIPLDSIRQVSVRRKASRAKATGIGAAIGFGIAFPIGATSAGFLADRNNPSIGTRAGFGAGLGLFGAGIGAGIGVLAGGPRFDIVYQSR